MKGWFLRASLLLFACLVAVGCKSVESRRPDQSFSAALLKSAMAGDFAGVESAIRQGADVNAADADGYTALMFAVTDLKVLKLITASGADLNKQDHLGWTALMGAAETGRTDTLKYLAANGADANLKNRYGQTALIRAAVYHRPHAVQSLVKLTLDLNAKDFFGKSALSYARDAGDDLTLRFLEKAGATLPSDYVKSYLIEAARRGDEGRLRVLATQCKDLGEKTGKQALVAAASEGHTKVLLALKELGVSLDVNGSEEIKALLASAHINNQEGMEFFLGEGMSINAADADKDTPILVAAATPPGWNFLDGDAKAQQARRKERLAFMKYVVSRGAAVDSVNNSGATPISRAIEWKASEIVQYLVKQGANINLGNSLLLEAVAAGDLDTLKLLLKMGANANAADADKKTALMQPINRQYVASEEEERRFIEMMKILIRYGANVNARSANDSTPLIEAARNGHALLVKFLLSQGAKINDSYVGGTALNEAAESGYLPIVRLLISRGARINSKADAGHTPLISAAQNGHTEVVKFLIRSGADLNATTGGTPPGTALEWARHFKHPEVADILSAAGAK